MLDLPFDLPARPQPAALSPGLVMGSLGPAFELKFHLSNAAAQVIENWARQHLNPDPHGQNGCYRVTSVYCDTPSLDVFHRSPGYRKSKHRLRRYDTAPFVFLERKTKRGERVKKRRTELPLSDIPLLLAPSVPTDWVGDWFLGRLRKRGLGPSCQVSYHRTAFYGQSSGSPIRLTLDRDLIGKPSPTWNLQPLESGVELLPGDALVELKYHITLPPLFRDLLPQLPDKPARVSKYRRCVELCGLAPARPNVQADSGANGSSCEPSGEGR